MKMTKTEKFAEIRDLLNNVEGFDTTDMVAFLEEEMALASKRAEYSRTRRAAKAAEAGPKEPKPRSEFMNDVIAMVQGDDVLAENLADAVFAKYPDKSIAQIRNALARGVKDGLLARVDVLVSVETENGTKATKRTAYHAI